MDDFILNYSVFVKTDQENKIIAVNSSAFLSNFDGWTRIDEGTGDRYHHAQGNYFPQPIYTEDGIPRYKLVDGKPVERTDEELEADRLPILADHLRKQRDALLAATDWTQMGDAPLTPEEQERIRDYRKQLRDLPQQEGFPTAITWPDIPKSLQKHREVMKYANLS